MTSLIWDFFQRAIFPVAYVATFSGQLYFWRNYFFTLLQSNYFDTKVFFFGAGISSELLFKELPFSEQLLLSNSHFFQNSYFFRAKLLPSSHFLRLGQVLFRRPTFLVEKLFRRVTFWKKLIFRKINIPHCLFFLDSYFSIAVTFSEELHNILFHKGCYSTATFPVLHFLFIS